MSKKTLVVGASPDPSRYSNIAINMLREAGHPVIAIGKKEGEVAGVSIQKNPAHETDIDTVTLYINPTFQKSYYDYLLELKPNRIIFNPGTENPELVALAKQAGISTMDACTLVMLRTGQY
jgi:predicted CoA-binding protein